MATDYRRELTDKIITALENGVAPWQKPWDGSVVKSMQPFNPISSTQYRGFNQLSLMMTPYDDPRWCTYKQAAEKGWQVRKGEKSTSIEFWKFYEDREQTDPDSGEVKKVKVKLDNQVCQCSSISPIVPIPRRYAMKFTCRRGKRFRPSKSFMPLHCTSWVTQPAMKAGSIESWATRSEA
jgi:hypothetical protein